MPVFPNGVNYSLKDKWCVLAIAYNIPSVASYDTEEIERWNSKSDIKRVHINNNHKERVSSIANCFSQMLNMNLLRAQLRYTIGYMLNADQGN